MIFCHSFVYFYFLFFTITYATGIPNREAYDKYLISLIDNMLDNAIKNVTMNPNLGKFLLYGDSITQRCFSYQEGKTFLFGPALTDGMYALIIKFFKQLL